jgi:hypothetical protein
LPAGDHGNGRAGDAVFVHQSGDGLREERLQRSCVEVGRRTLTDGDRHDTYEKREEHGGDRRERPLERKVGTMELDVSHGCSDQTK